MHECLDCFTLVRENYRPIATIPVDATNITNDELRLLHPSAGRHDPYRVPDARVQCHGQGDHACLLPSGRHGEFHLSGSELTNDIMADTNASLSDRTNTRFTFVTNNIGHTLLKQMNLYMNGIVMSAQTNT